MGKKVWNFIKTYNTILIILFVFSSLYLLTGDFFIPFVIAMLLKRIGLIVIVGFKTISFKRKVFHYEKKERYIQYCDTCQKEVFTQRMGNIYIALSFFAVSLPIALFYYELSIFHSILVGLGCALLGLLGISSVRCTKCYSKTQKIKKEQNLNKSTSSVDGGLL